MRQSAHVSKGVWRAARRLAMDSRPCRNGFEGLLPAPAADVASPVSRALYPLRKDAPTLVALAQTRAASWALWHPLRQ